MLFMVSGELGTFHTMQGAGVIELMDYFGLSIIQLACSI